MKNTEEIKMPLTVTIIDMFDAYHYADVFDAERYTVIGKNYTNLEKATALADRLFSALNFGDKTQTDWIKWEAGHDVRIYDADSTCIYKAHEKLPK